MFSEETAGGYRRVLTGVIFSGRPNLNFQTPGKISDGRLLAAAPVRKLGELPRWPSPPALAVTARNWRRRIQERKAAAGLAASAFNFAAQAYGFLLPSGSF